MIYSRRKAFIDLPVIILSGVVGFLSVGSQQMFTGSEGIASICLGLLSLFISILNTIGSYYKWGQKAEQHRVSCIEYAKLYRELSVQLAIPRSQRMRPNDLLKFCKDAYDRLAEISTLLPNETIKEFQLKYKQISDIAQPEETNGLHKIEVYNEERKVESATPKKSDIKITVV